MPFCFAGALALSSCSAHPQRSSGAFGAFGCKKCGKIPRAEFPPDVQNRMMLGSWGMVAGAIVLFVVVLVAIVALNSK